MALTNKEIVRQAIQSLVNEASITAAAAENSGGNILDENKPEVLAADIKTHLTNSLTDFVANSVVKFIKGQKEHGGDIRARNLPEERKNEIIDLFFYNEADSWRVDIHRKA